MSPWLDWTRLERFLLGEQKASQQGWRRASSIWKCSPVSSEVPPLHHWVGWHRLFSWFRVHTYITLQMLVSLKKSLVPNVLNPLLDHTQYRWQNCLSRTGRHLAYRARCLKNESINQNQLDRNHIYKRKEVSGLINDLALTRDTDR